MKSLTILFVIIGLFVFVQTAFASENTTFAMRENVTIVDGKITRTFAHPVPYMYEGYEPIDHEREERLDYWKKRQSHKFANLPKNSFTINASAYTAAFDETGSGDGITASGVVVQKNRTLACPPEYPFGAKVKIDGMGVYTCEDRGGAIKGNKFDIYMETKTEAFAFGRRNLVAQVIQ